MSKLSRALWGSSAALVLWVALGGGDARANAPFVGGGDKNRERAARALRQGEFEVAESIYRALG